VNLNLSLLCAAICAATLTVAGCSDADGADQPPPGSTSLMLAQNPTFSTRITTPLAIEGLTGDNAGSFYTTGRSPGAGLPCPVWRIPPGNAPALEVVGLVPAPSATGQCAPSGLTFGPNRNIFLSEADKVYTFAPNAATPPTATVYASGVPGTNGLAFDRSGNLWTGDGTTAQGRVWKISASGAMTEVFRVQPMANEVNLVNGVGGVGRDVRSLPPGAITVTPTSRNAADTAGSQPLVANGIAFNQSGQMFIADTARGALWRVEFNGSGEMTSRTGCDTTFTANTLCMENVYVQHPLLEGADGIAVDVGGNIWVDANERNAIVAVRSDRTVIEVFRNAPDATTKLRNTGPLETPTSPFLLGNLLCTANSDGNRRDNSPNTAGEIGGTGQPRGKISCMDQPAMPAGLQLPVQ
jgi:sugar lactone lactonase YvrE